VGFGKASEIAAARLDEDAVRVAALRDRLEKRLMERVGHVRLNGDPENRLPNTSNLSFAFVEAEAIMMNLDLAGVAVSTGSACSSGTQDPSHVLLAMGLTREEANSAIRFSLGRENTEEEMDDAVHIIARVVERLREASPLYQAFEGENDG
jgi:cysteine desulfurase